MNMRSLRVFLASLVMLAFSPSSWGAAQGYFTGNFYGTGLAAITLQSNDTGEVMI
jgi:hypothetical protein